MARSRRERLRAQTLNEIKQTARYQMRELGVEHISLRGIAREMGMTAPAIYRYFANYSELIASLAGDALNSLTVALDKADRQVLAAGADINSAETQRKRLRTLGHTYREWALDWPQDYFLLFRSPIPIAQITPVKPQENADPEAKREYQLLFEILLSADNNNQLKVAKVTGQPTPAIEAIQAQWQASFGTTPAAEVIQAGVLFLAALEGHVFMELSKRFGGVSAEIFPNMLEQQIAALTL